MDNNSPPAVHAAKIAVLLPSLEGGGAERSMLNLIKGFLAQGRAVDLVLCQAKGAYIGEVPAGANLVELEAVGGMRARLSILSGNLQNVFLLLGPVLLPKKIAPEVARNASLQAYMKTAQPDIILSALTYANLLLIWAKQQSGSQIPIVISERNALATYCAASPNSRKWRWRYLPKLVKRTYPSADAIVAVSSHAADELISKIGVTQPRAIPIHNPVVDDSLRAKAEEPLAHPWFAPEEILSVPVILAVGRLTEQKDFATLMRAFAQVHSKRRVRLVILGEGRLRTNLESLANSLGIQNDIEMPGFVSNPFQYMARAPLLVLPSLYEGLPGVLIQAMACGCPVISTDCPGGSREILADGKYGTLVRIGDVNTMATAIEAELDNATEKDLVRSRAEDFSVARAVSNYLELLDSVVTHAANRNK